MTVSQSTRLQVYRWTEDTDAVTRSQFDTTNANIEAYVAKLTTGTSNPTVGAAYNRSFFFNTDTDKLYFYDSGDASGAWREITLDPSINKSIFTSAGQILYSTGSGTPAVLAAGTSGQFLTTSGTAVSWADAVTPTGTQTLTNKTLTSPTINTATINRSSLAAPFESWTVSGSAIGSGTVNIDVSGNSSAYLYTGSSTSSWTPNIRHSSGASLNDNMSIGQSITIAIAVNIGATAACATALQVDGTGQTIKWQGGIAVTSNSGNSGNFDVYTYTIIKTDSATYTVLASRTKFG